MFGLFKKKSEIRTVSDIRARLKSHFNIIDPYEFRLFNKNNNSLHDDNESIKMPELKNYTGLNAKTVRRLCKVLENKFSGVGQRVTIKLWNTSINQAVHGKTKRDNVTSG